MAGKNIGLIVSSHSSGISLVVADAKRLLPKGNFFSESLWINNSNFSNRNTIIMEWLSKTTAISNVVDSIAKSNKIYTLSGRVLAEEPNKGVFIRNGQKIVNRQ